MQIDPYVLRLHCSPGAQGRPYDGSPTRWSKASTENNNGDLVRFLRIAKASFPSQHVPTCLSLAQPWIVQLTIEVLTRSTPQRGSTYASYPFMRHMSSQELTDIGARHDL